MTRPRVSTRRADGGRARLRRAVARAGLDRIHASAIAAAARRCHSDRRSLPEAATYCSATVLVGTPLMVLPLRALSPKLSRVPPGPAASPVPLPVIVEWVTRMVALDP